MKPIKKVALLHDLCSIGKAALTNMLPILGVMGIESCPIPTMLLSSHTGGYGKPVIQQISGSYISACADHYIEQGIMFDAIFIGYLGSDAIVDAVSYFIKQYPTVPVIFDPIMGDHGDFYSNFDSSYMNSLKRLLPYVDVLLPNYTEFCLFSNIAFQHILTENQIAMYADRLPLKQDATLVITSIPGANKTRRIFLGEGHQTKIYEFEPIPQEFHGSGDAFDGVYLGNLLNGISHMESIKNAHDFVNKCIKKSMLYDYPEREGLMIEAILPDLV